MDARERIEHSARRFEPQVVRLRDGSSVTVRLATPDDEPALRNFLGALCPEARRLRFFTGALDVASAAHDLSAANAHLSGLVAHDTMGVLVGHAIYVEENGLRAEVAVEVADHLHDRGLGTILLERLAAVAEDHGIETFIAEVLPENRAMLDVFRDGFDARVTLARGIEAVEFPTSTWSLARERFSRAM